MGLIFLRDSTDYHLTEIFSFIWTWIFSPWLHFYLLLLPWHLHFTTELFKDALLLLIYEVRESDKPHKSLCMSDLNIKFSERSRRICHESHSLLRITDAEAGFIIANPTHGSMNFWLYLGSMGVTSCSVKKIRAQKDRSISLSDSSSYYLWTTISPVSVGYLRLSCMKASWSCSFLGQCNYRRLNRYCYGSELSHIREAQGLSLRAVWGFINSCLLSAKY